MQTMDSSLAVLKRTARQRQFLLIVKNIRHVTKSPVLSVTHYHINICIFYHIYHARCRD